MTDERFTPEEFARLLALPPENPERRRAESDPRFDAWRRMLSAFESREAHGLSADELRTADAALARRVEAQIGVAPGGVFGARTSSPSVRRIRNERGESRGLWSWLTPSPALAMAAALIVAGGVWMYSAREPAERVVRGSETGAASVAVSMHDGRELRWSAVPGADEYRVTFFGPDLTEIAHVAGLTATTLAMRSESLPAGLTRGTEVAVKVAAYREGQPLAESRTTAIRVP